VTWHVERSPGTRFWAHLLSRIACAALLTTAVNAETYSEPQISAAKSGRNCVSNGVGLDSECAVNVVRLHFVDWGGTGDNLVLVAGLDDSARIFDELAPMLARRHHVIAVTRRGFCHSQVTPSGYDAENLAKDFGEFLAAVGVTRADIVGHSMAGLELTHFATSHPDRVRRLVYIDAATDKSALPPIMAKDPLGNRNPPAGALENFADLTRWTQALLKSHSPAIAANLKACFEGQPGGLRFRTPASVEARVFASMVADHPDYSSIQSPALAIYSDYSRADQVPIGTSAAVRAAADAFTRATLYPWQALQKALFRLEIPCGRTLELTQTGHYIFLERPAETVEWIESFLASPDPCTWVPMRREK
jgi:pimeloyl-ACP methyl ester carboxylesterase